MSSTVMTFFPVPFVALPLTFVDECVNNMDLPFLSLSFFEFLVFPLRGILVF